LLPPDHGVPAALVRTHIATVGGPFLTRLAALRSDWDWRLLSLGRVLRRRESLTPPEDESEDESED